MQITIKSLRVIKEDDGKESGKRAYKWVSVVADDGSVKGTEYTTFDAGVLKLGVGSVIDIGEVEIKEGKLKFKKVITVISAAAVVAVPAPKGAGKASLPDMSKEEWKEKQRIERASFEAQTAYKGALGLFTETGMAPAEAKELIELAIAWGIKRLNPTLGEVLGTMPHVARLKSEGEGTKTFRNIGGFLTAMLEKGFSRKQVIGELIRLKLIKNESELPRLDPEVAWEILKDVIKAEDIPF